MYGRDAQDDAEIVVTAEARCSMVDLAAGQVIPDERVIAELAPTGELRAGINLGNFLLVTGRDEAGDPQGVAPDLAREIARRLGVPVRYVPYDRPGALADAAGSGAWDIGLIGAEPARARTIAFTDAYVEIESTFLVPAGSDLGAIADVDRAGIRIAVNRGSAYDLWLTRHIVQAELVRAESIEDAFGQFVQGGLEALAGLRPRLLSDVARLPGARILEGTFATVQQAVGTARANVAGASYLAAFVAEAKRSGLVADLLARHGVEGLTVPRPA